MSKKPLKTFVISTTVTITQIYEVKAASVGAAIEKWEEGNLSPVWDDIGEGLEELKDCHEKRGK